MAEKEQFKKYAAAMAQKRQRKAERKKIAKGKERTLPAKLTIQRLAAQVKGSSQRYSRMGPLKRVEILEDDLCEAASIDTIRRACIAGFNLIGMSCDILETERGPSIESVDDIKNLNGTIFVRLINHTFTLSDSETDELPEADFLRSHQKKPKLARACAPAKSSPTKAASQTADNITGTAQKPVAPSLSVTAMMRLGRLISPRKETIIQVQGFDVNNDWSPSRNVSFYVEDEQFAEGGFRKAYKCTSCDENFPGTWLLKRYNDTARKDLQTLGMGEEEHARKQTQMHTPAKNIADQMAKKVSSEFGETFYYNEIYFGKIQVNGNITESVTIEQFIEGKPFIKYMNNTGEIFHDCTTVVVQKVEALAHFSYQVSREKFLLVDIQGIGYKLCDPEIASADLVSYDGAGNKLNFCIGNLSQNAIKLFLEHHCCNSYCKDLKLEEHVMVL